MSPKLTVKITGVNQLLDSVRNGFLNSTAPHKTAPARKNLSPKSRIVVIFWGRRDRILENCFSPIHNQCSTVHQRWRIAGQKQRHLSNFSGSAKPPDRDGRDSFCFCLRGIGSLVKLTLQHGRIDWPWAECIDADVVFSVLQRQSTSQ